MRRRVKIWILAAAVVAVAIAAAIFLRAGRRPPRGAPSESDAALTPESYEAGRSIRLSDRVPPVPEPDSEVAPPRVALAEPSLPPPVDLVEEAPPADGPDVHLELPDAESELDAALFRPTTWVHPEIPERVLKKKKIDAAVRLQVLIGADGRVRRARVLQSILECDECNRNAVAAAEKFIYPSLPLAPGQTEVWSPPFEFRFSYRGR